MPPYLALLICVCFIIWLFARDRKLRPMTSWGLWVALAWIVIVGTRSISLWFGGGIKIEIPEGYLEGSPLDRNVYFLLMVTGLIVLLRRRISWDKIFRSNPWLFAFFFYCCLSLIWSDYPVVGFKRWMKDIGNVVIVLIIFTEKDPVQAIKALFARYTYIVIPLSVVLIKYFPEFGRFYNHWTWEYVYCGVAEHKNALGAIVFICSMYLVWDLVAIRRVSRMKNDIMDLFDRVLLLLMVVWLMVKAGSSTALLCMILGIGILFFMELPFGRRRVRHIGMYAVILLFFLFFLYSIPGVFEVFTGIMDKDTTLTGRTDLWAEVFRKQSSFFFGTGYGTFWLGPRMEHLWEEFSFHPVQAHNGYIETYLNLGLIGVCLLFAMIFSAGSGVKKELVTGSSFGRLRLSLFVVTLFYNFTEAAFSKMGLVWIVFLISIIDYPHLPKSIRGNIAEGENE